MFSLPLGPARLRRPEIFFRYTFKHFLDGLSRRSSLPDPARLSVVPIESVAPGDVQVLAARESGNVKTLVTDLDVLANFPSVESVVASTAVRANRDLCKVRLGSMIGADAEKLRAARPDMDIDYTPPNPKLQALGEQIGSVTIQKPGGGLKQWSIFQSLAPGLRLETNYDAEARIKKELNKRDPALAKRLDGDSEAEAVGVYAKTESDIRSVAEVINDLLNTFMQKHHSIPAS